MKIPWRISDDFGLRSSVSQKLFYTKSFTSIVACVYGLILGHTLWFFYARLRAWHFGTEVSQKRDLAGAVKTRSENGRSEAAPGSVGRGEQGEARPGNSALNYFIAGLKRSLKLILRLLSCNLDSTLHIFINIGSDRHWSSCCTLANGRHNKIIILQWYLWTSSNIFGCLRRLQPGLRPFRSRPVKTIAAVPAQERIEWTTTGPKIY